MDMRYRCSVAALKELSVANSVDIPEDDVEFLHQSTIWLAAQRNRARRCIEAFAFGALDIIGLARFPLPAEFVAAVIVQHVNPVNWKIACRVMDGCEWSEAIILGREEKIDAATLYAHCLRISAAPDEMDRKERKVRAKVREVESA